MITTITKDEEAWLLEHYKYLSIDDIKDSFGMESRKECTDLLASYGIMKNKEIVSTILTDEFNPMDHMFIKNSKEWNEFKEKLISLKNIIKVGTKIGSSVITDIYENHCVVQTINGYRRSYTWFDLTRMIKGGTTNVR